MRTRACILALAAALAAVAAAGCGSSHTAGRATLPVVVDTDLSSDDVIALLYLLRSPQVDVRAVTVAGTGLVHCPVGARNALELLALAGREDVPVACGSGLPLRGYNELPADWRKAADGLFGLELPPASATAQGHAVALLRQEAPGTTVVELAPMTNLAGALRAEPGLATRITAVVAMAGAVSVPGNAPGQPAAETNAWVDPAALRTVLRSGVPLTLVPLDATNHVPATPYVGQALKRYHYATPEATAAWELVFATAMADGGSYFWDPLAAAAVVDPEVVRTEEQRIAVDDAGRTFESATGARTAVAIGADRVRFEKALLGTLLGGAPFTISRHPTATVTWDGETCSYQGPPSLTAGRVIVDALDRTDKPFQPVVAEIRPPRTLSDLQAYISALSGPPTSPPPWLTMQALGTVQPRSEMTWAAYAASGTSGSVVIACAMEAPPFAAIATKLLVYAEQ
jgi:inosine-uridine nucleoside N-ribohydrolase